MDDGKSSRLVRKGDQTSFRGTKTFSYLLGLGCIAAQCTRSATIWGSGPPKHPLFESVVGQSPNLFTNYHLRWLPMWRCMFPPHGGWCRVVTFAHSTIANCMQITIYPLIGGHLMRRARHVNTSDVNSPHSSPLPLPHVTHFSQHFPPTSWRVSLKMSIQWAEESL